MDYQKELDRLKENESQGSGDYWKPEPGQHRVKALSELEDSEPFEKEGEETQQRKKIAISVNNAEFMWTMPVGRTPASAYGQLINLGSTKGSLKDQEFTVVTTGNGQNIRYTIVV